MNSFWTYWYFHIPNFILAALVYTMLGRLVLGLFVPETWDNYIWRAFKRLTDPVVIVVRAATPAALPHLVVLVFATLWLMVLRVALAVALSEAGLMPAAMGGATS
jgi:uncharacterized protein YggT (Ycf19 family)